jgi:pyridoxal phosphate enzyme (YggS family)
MSINRLSENLESVRTAIAEAASRAGRPPEEIRLVAVTKRRGGDLVRALSALSVTDFGENYPQELWEKVESLADLPVRWHLIGHLQGNKAKRTLPMVRMIHGVDSLKLLRTLDDLAADLPEPPAVCLQVNGSGEESKHGWSPDALLADAPAIASFRSIPIVGLMTMAGYDTDNETARPTFVLVRELRDRLRELTGLPLPHLSMGMSNDFVAAVEEGATLVRVGSALFEGIDP